MTLDQVVSAGNSKHTTLDDLIASNAVAAKYGAMAGAFTLGFGYLMDKTIRQVLPAAGIFAGLLYGFSLMYRAESTLGKFEGLVIAGLLAVPAGYLVYKTVPLVFQKLYFGVNYIAAGAYKAAIKPLATVAAGAYLGFRLLKSTYNGVKGFCGRVRSWFSGKK